jgi:penicillin amidase
MRSCAEASATPLTGWGSTTEKIRTGGNGGKLHTLTFRHRPLGLAQVPVLSQVFSYGPIPDPACDRFTVNAAWFTPDEDAESPFASVAGTSQRIIMDLHSWDNSVAVNSTGQSEHLFHPHRDDEIELWRKLEYHPLFFTRKAVEADGASVLKLSSVNKNAAQMSAISTAAGQR